MYEQIIGLMIEFFQNMMLEELTEENVQVMLYEILKMMGLNISTCFSSSGCGRGFSKYYASWLYVFNRIHSI